MLGTVRRDAEMEAAGACSSFEFAYDVPTRSHLRRVPCRHGRVVHGEAVAVLGDRNDVLCACAGEEIEPHIRVEVLRAEHRDEVFVAELRLWAVSGNVVLKRRAAGDIHVARVPLVSECRNGVDAPVNEDAELGITEPAGRAVLRERTPGGPVDILVRGIAVGRADFA